MTFIEAKMVRARELSGGYVKPEHRAEAIWLLRSDGKRAFSAARFVIDNEQVRLLEVEMGRLS